MAHRILQVMASLDRGGAEVMIMTLYRNIDREKFQFDFVVNDRQQEYAFENEIKSMGGRIFRFPRYTILNHFKYKQAWVQLLIEHPEWKIIHGHHTTPAMAYIPVAKSLNRVTIAHSHTAGTDASLKSILKIVLRYPLRNTAKYLFACSNEAAKWMFGKKEVHILTNAIDTNKFSFKTYVRQQKRDEFSLNNSFTIGHIGRFDKSKNQSFVVDIFNDILKKEINSRLLLVGDGILRPKIEKKIQQSGLQDKITVTGARSDIADLLQAMDVLVLPSMHEGLPVTLIEAQASGLVCVVSDNITREVNITDSVYFFSLNKTAGEWASFICQFARGYKRKQNVGKIIKAGYDITANVIWLENFYQEATEVKSLNRFKIETVI